MQLFLKAVLHKYPAFLKDLEERHIHYNETLEELSALEKEGRVHIIRPSSPIQAAMIERDESNLERIYQTGRADIEKGSGEAESLPGFLNHRPKQNSTYTPFYVMIVDIITTERGIFNGRKTSEYKTQTYKLGRACPRGCRKDDIIGRPAF